MGEAGQAWVNGLPGRLEDLVGLWGLTLGRPLPGGSASYVVRARTRAGESRVLKVGMPDSGLADEGRVLAAADGAGYALLFGFDGHPTHESLLLEELGPSLEQGGGEPDEVLGVLAETLVRAWEVDLPMVSTSSSPSGSSGSTNGGHSPFSFGSIDGASESDGRAGRPAGADRRRDHPQPEQGKDPSNKAESLLAGIEANAAHLPEELRERVGPAIDSARETARELAASYQPDVVVHGDPHPGNALRRSIGEWAFVDPDGFWCEREYDLGVTIRDFSRRLLDAPTDAEAHQLVSRWAVRVAERTGTDAERVEAWGFVERVSTGLYVCSIGSPQVGVPLLASAARLVRHTDAR